MNKNQIQAEIRQQQRKIINNTKIKWLKCFKKAQKKGYTNSYIIYDKSNTDQINAVVPICK